jgi:predicted RNase H-like HicB family nuclease
VNYTVIYERTPTGYSAYLPDLPGCVAAAKTRAEAERLIQSALRAHVAMLRSRGEPVPPPSTSSGTASATEA